MRTFQTRKWFRLVAFLIVTTLCGMMVWSTIRVSYAQVGEPDQPLVTGDTFTVNSVEDGSDAQPGNGICADAGGSCTLRAALEEANASEGTDGIEFALGGVGPHRIQPISPLPHIVDSIVIDGWSQPDVGNTPNIELDGSLLADSDSGLVILAGDSLVKGLVIQNFPNSGIYLLGNNNNFIEGNYIGTDVSGTTAQGNHIGVLIEASSGNFIGNNSVGNLISGNEVGVYIYERGANGNSVEGNLIGTTADGMAVLGNAYGIRITNANGNSVGGVQTGRRNIISGNRTGLYIRGEQAHGNQVQGNYFGLDISGLVALTGQDTSIYIFDAGSNVIGTPNRGQNLIAGEDSAIYLRGPNAQNNVIRGNGIGVDANQTALPRPADHGIYIVDARNNEIGGPSGEHGNRIVGFHYGISVRGFDDLSNSSQNNIIEIRENPGTADTQPQSSVPGSADYSVSAILPQTDVPAVATSGAEESPIKILARVQFQTGTTYTVDSTGDGNDANPGDGYCDDGSGNCTLRAAIKEANTDAAADVIEFNLSGTAPFTIAINSWLPTITKALIIDGTSQSGYSDHPVIALDGSNAGANAPGLNAYVTDITILGLAIHSFDGDGIFLDSGADGAIIQGNFIGTNHDGSAGFGNGGDGIALWRTEDTQIGGTGANEGNLIADNGGYGIAIYGYNSDGNNTFEGNIIGTDIDGATDMGNGYDGILIYDSDNNIIGGTAEGAGNLISGNDDDGIEIEDGSSGTSVFSNQIGTNISGTVAIANADSGVEVDDAPANYVGGASAGQGNLISGNSGNGVTLQDWGSYANLVYGNSIGLSSSGGSLGNGGHGVAVINYGIEDNKIGGTSAGEGNAIANNTSAGIYVDGYADYIRIQGNMVFTNGGLGIDLQATGVNSNDTGDGDYGANDGQNYPVVGSALVLTSSVAVTGTLNSVASSTFTLDFYYSSSCDGTGYGEGELWVGTANVTTNGSGDIAFTTYLTDVLGTAEYVTATATDAYSNTSEFSSCLAFTYSTITRTWQIITPTNSPLVYGEYAMAYDSSRDRTVLYGGVDTGWPYENSTWEFDGSNWSQISLTQTLSAEYGMSMVFDSQRDLVVLFGGSDSDDTVLSETWEYNGTIWTQASPTTSPPARRYASMVFSPVYSATYLFGGNNDEAVFNDLWKYDGSTWTQISPSASPPSRTLHAMAYDSDTGVMLLFGGRDASGQMLDDLWEFDPGTDTWTELTDSDPVARMGHSLAYDPDTTEFLLVGGYTTQSDAILDNAWLYSFSSAWTSTTSPAAVVFHTVVYDSANHRLILFGNGQTWIFE